MNTASFPQVESGETEGKENGSFEEGKEDKTESETTSSDDKKEPEKEELTPKPKKKQRMKSLDTFRG